VATIQRCVEIIYSAIEEHNEMQPREKHLEKSPGTVLFGRAGNLDSLGLVQLIIGIEEKVEEEFGRPISIVDERTLSQQESPLATVETLAEYITSLLEEGAHA